MFKEILITRDEREGRAAVLEDGVLSEFLIAREERQVGSIYKGRVANVLPGMNAAFVDLGLERNGFLCADDAAARERVIGLANLIDGVRGVDGGGIENARYVEDFTAMLLNINRIYGAHSTIKIVGI